MIEECVKIFDQPNLEDYSAPATTNQVDRASKAFEGLIIALKAMGHKEIIVDGEIFYKEAAKFLETMSVTSKFKIRGEDSFTNLFDYYQASENRCQIVLDSETRNFIHRVDEDFGTHLDAPSMKAIEANFELPSEKIDVAYFFKVDPDDGVPPRCHPLHSPHIYRYGTIGFAFLMSMPFNWSSEKDHYSVVFNYYRKGAYRRCERKISMLNGDWPYVRYLLDEWIWGEEPVKMVAASINASSDKTNDGLSDNLAKHLTSLLYYMNIIWLIESHELQLKTSDRSFLNFDSLSKSEKASQLDSFCKKNTSFLERCYADFESIKQISGLDLDDIDHEDMLRHYGIIPSR